MAKFNPRTEEFDLITKSLHRNILKNIRIEYEGDWKRVGPFFDKLPAKIQKKVYRGQVRYSELYLKALKETINSQGTNISPRWAPLGPGYEDTKASLFQRKPGVMYGPTNLWKLTGKAYKNIKIFKDPNNHTVQVGISRNEGVKNLQGNLTVSQYVNILEHGSHSRNIAKRPLFGPTFRLLGGRKKLSEIVLQEAKLAILEALNLF